MTELIQQSPAAPLLEMVGAGAVSVAAVLTASSHPGRVRSEAAFASLAGVNPLPASSGNTVRHRLNRGGDRRLNRALHTITMTRMVHHPGTREYVAKRTQEGRGYREIRRSPSATLPEPSTVSSTPFTPLWIQPAHVLQGQSPANSSESIAIPRLGLIAAPAS